MELTLFDLPPANPAPGKRGKAATKSGGRERPVEVGRPGRSDTDLPKATESGRTHQQPPVLPAVDDTPQRRSAEATEPTHSPQVADVFLPEDLRYGAIKPVFLIETEDGIGLFDEAGHRLTAAAQSGEESFLTILPGQTLVTYAEKTPLAGSLPPHPFSVIPLADWFARFNGEYANPQGHYRRKELAYACGVLSVNTGQSCGFPPPPLLAIWQKLVGNPDNAFLLANFLQLEAYCQHKRDMLRWMGEPPELPAGSPDHFRFLTWQVGQSGEADLTLIGVPEGEVARQQIIDITGRLEAIRQRPIQLSAQPMGLRLVRYRIGVEGP